MAKRFGGTGSGEKARIKWACPDLCKFFISASPERSEIPLVEKQERRGNCQSILFDNLPRVQQSTRSKKISWKRVFLTVYDLLSKFQSVSSLNVWKDQETAVKGLLMGRDVPAVLPTGYGKSFIFQTYVMASPVPELSFLPAPCRGWTLVSERRVQDNLHAHAQSEPIKNY